MVARYFNEENDMNLLNTWLKDRGLDPIVEGSLPKYGLIVGDVAAGFIRKCEGNFCFLDSVVADPKASKDSRDDALDCLFYQLNKLAYILGFSHVIGYSVNDKTIERSKKFGFKESEHKLMTLSLKENKWDSYQAY